MTRQEKKQSAKQAATSTSDSPASLLAQASSLRTQASSLASAGLAELSEAKDQAQQWFATRWQRGIDWPVAVWLIIVHLGALAAPFFFTWKAVLITLVLGWLTGGVGICLGYHRLLTHSSFHTFRAVRWAIAILGGLAGQGSPISWVAAHRQHHAFSDHDGDPHSPRNGRWWSHMLWFLPKFDRQYVDALYERYAPDLLKERFMRFLDRTFLLWYILLGLALFLIGFLGWNLYTGFSLLFWGMFVRMVFVLHSTWLVNSATHLWGYRTYETSDDSRNLWWVGLLTYGEGWHNNHHAFQRCAKHGHRWWEVDMTYWTIWGMEHLGLAWDVVRVSRDKRQAVRVPH